MVREALAENASLPSCDAYDEEENSWILILGLDPLRNDGSEEGSNLLIDRSTALSACPPQICTGTRDTERKQSDYINVNFQRVDVH